MRVIQSGGRVSPNSRGVRYRKGKLAARVRSHGPQNGAVENTLVTDAKKLSNGLISPDGDGQTNGLATVDTTAPKSWADAVERLNSPLTASEVSNREDG